MSLYFMEETVPTFCSPSFISKLIYRICFVEDPDLQKNFSADAFTVQTERNEMKEDKAVFIILERKIPPCFHNSNIVPD